MVEVSQLKFNSDGSLHIPGVIKEDLDKRKGGELDIWEDPDFSEEKFNLDENVEGFNFFKNGERKGALEFSNGKTQGDVVEEVVSLIRQGKKVIFVKGVCGSGKSAMALNIAKKLGSASVIVPGKALQKQYYDDYSKECYILKNDHKKLKIRVITGRQNHKCLFCKGESADFAELPCKIEIKESNYEKLKEYLKENPKVKNDLELKDIRRISVAPVCPYWSPIISSDYDFPLKSDKKKYIGVTGKEFVIHNRKKGCSYYNQFNSYVDAEAIIFNSAKYKLEMLMNRKPKTHVEIIDECDEFLDSFSNVRKINLNRLQSALNHVFVTDVENENTLLKLRKIVADIVYDRDFKNAIDGERVFKLNETSVLKLFEVLGGSYQFMKEVDEDSYVHSVFEVVCEFSDFLEDSFISFSENERGFYLSVVTTNLAKKFKELIDKTEAIVMMSGTIHDENILRYVYGLDDFEVIDAEVMNHGEIDVKRTGNEFDCKYSNFRNGNNSRKDFLKAFEEVIEIAPKPALVHINSFDDLPSDDEKRIYDLDNLMSKSKMLSLQKEAERQVKRFKHGEIPVLFTTKCGRGVDFPLEQCRSIVFTKYPNPQVNSLFWKILKETHPQYYWQVYKDKARREFLQKIYRGVRSKEDHVYILSPDKRVLDAVSLI
jgi:Rad3-related DNA helicase